MGSTRCNMRDVAFIQQGEVGVHYGAYGPITIRSKASLMMKAENGVEVILPACCRTVAEVPPPGVRSLQDFVMDEIRVRRTNHGWESRVEKSATQTPNRVGFHRRICGVGFFEPRKRAAKVPLAAGLDARRSDT